MNITMMRISTQLFKVMIFQCGQNHPTYMKKLRSKQYQKQVISIMNLADCSSESSHTRKLSERGEK